MSSSNIHEAGPSTDRGAEGHRDDRAPQCDEGAAPSAPIATPALAPHLLGNSSMPPPASAPAPAGHEAHQPPRSWNDVSLESLRTRLADFAHERDWDKYHTPRNLLLALVGETGELCELFQWRPDSDAGAGLPGFSQAERTAVEEELADVLLYLVRLADGCGVDLGRAAVSKIQKNALKYPADRCRGSSAKYTSYDTQAQQPKAHAQGSEQAPQPQGPVLRQEAPDS